MSLCSVRAHSSRSTLLLPARGGPCSTSSFSPATRFRHNWWVAARGVRKSAANGNAGSSQDAVSSSIVSVDTRRTACIQTFGAVPIRVSIACRMSTPATRLACVMRSLNASSVAVAGFHGFPVEVSRILTSVPFVTTTIGAGGCTSRAYERPCAPSSAVSLMRGLFSSMTARGLPSFSSRMSSRASARDFPFSTNRVCRPNLKLNLIWCLIAPSGSQGNAILIAARTRASRSASVSVVVVRLLDISHSKSSTFPLQ